MTSSSHIILQNQHFAEKYITKGKFYNKIAHEHIDEKQINKIFSCILILASHFQKMVLTRCLFHRTPLLQSISKQHLAEEIGHDDYLKNNEFVSRMDDALLESYCTWFVYKMMFEDDLKSSVLMHLVIEEAADIMMPNLSNMVKKTCGDESKYLKYIVLHEHLDCNHSDLLNPIIEKLNLSSPDLEDLLKETEKGWQLMNAFFERVHALVFDK